MTDTIPRLRLILPEGEPGALARLHSLLPGLESTPLGLEIPLADLGAEEALAICLRTGVTCRGTRVVEPSRQAVRPQHSPPARG